jgi:cytochrome b561
LRWRNTRTQYGAITLLFHWSIVALVLTQFVLGERAHDLPVSMERLKTLALHKSIGMTIFALMLLRLGWRLTNPTPALPPGRTLALARLTHGAFYLLLVAVPVSGWLLSSASNLSVSYFQLFTLPDLVSANEPLADGLKELHEFLNATLAVLACVHVAAALVHHFWWRDDVLLRMLPVSASRQRRSLSDTEQT